MGIPCSLFYENLDFSPELFHVQSPCCSKNHTNRMVQVLIMLFLCKFRNMNCSAPIIRRLQFVLD